MLYIACGKEEIPEGYAYIHDVEAGFNKTSDRSYDPASAAVIKYVDEATLDERGNVIDRDGYRIRWSNLSTGCKAALILLKSKDKKICVNTVECGVNALQAIIRWCREGAILTDYIGYTLLPGDIDVWYDGEHYTDGDIMQDEVGT